MGAPRDKPSSIGTDLLSALAGAACAVSAVGVAPALADAHSPLRAPFVLFFLFTGPVSGAFAALPGLAPSARAATATAGGIALVPLVAWLVSSLHVLTVDGGVIAVAATTCLLHLRAAAGRIRNTEPAHPSDQLKKAIKRIRSGRPSLAIRISTKKVKR